jgi:hypothetical protein
MKQLRQELQRLRLQTQVEQQRALLLQASLLLRQVDPPMQAPQPLPEPPPVMERPPHQPLLTPADPPPPVTVQPQRPPEPPDPMLLVDQPWEPTEADRLLGLRPPQT